MPEYRRAFAPGGTFFFTLVTENRTPLLCHPHARRCLKNAFITTRQRWPFDITAIVLLPDHLHTIWTLPPNDTDFSRRWAFLKKTFTRAWLACGMPEQTTSWSRIKNRRRGVWQRRFWEHTIRDDRDFERHCDYIHHNPVKHELAACPHAWPYSSFHRFVKERRYNVDWHCACQGRRRQPVRFDDLAATAME